jgi:phosphoribosylpyrophosphate synthetase
LAVGQLRIHAERYRQFQETINQNNLGVFMMMHYQTGYQKRYRCSEIEHTEIKTATGVCNMCGKQLNEKWLPFTTSTKVELSVFTLCHKTELNLQPIQAYQGDFCLNLLTYDITTELMYLDLGFININKVKRKNESSSLLQDKPIYKSSYLDWQNRYLTKLNLYNKSIFELINSQIGENIIDAIIMPETRSPELRAGIEELFLMRSGMLSIIAKKVNKNQYASEKKEQIVQFESIAGDLKDKNVLILDDCISSFKTVYGIIEACSQTINEQTKFYVGAYYYDHD